MLTESRVPGKRKNNPEHYGLKSVCLCFFELMDPIRESLGTRDASIYNTSVRVRETTIYPLQKEDIQQSSVCQLFKNFSVNLVSSTDDGIWPDCNPL